MIDGSNYVVVAGGVVVLGAVLAAWVWVWMRLAGILAGQGDLEVRRAGIPDGADDRLLLEIGTVRAVDEQRLAGGPLGLGQAEEDDGGGDILRPAEAAEGDESGGPVVVDERGAGLVGDGTGGNAVDGDPMRPSS